MKTRTLLFIALLIIMPAVSYGQLGRLIKNTASKAIGTVGKESVKEANRQADSVALEKARKAAADKAASNQSDNNQPGQSEVKEEQTQGKSQSQGQGGMNMGKLFGNKIDLKYKEDYSFSSRLYMQTETYDKKDVLKMDMYMYFSSSTPSVGMETKSITDSEGNATPVTSSMVMDGENKSFIILTDVNGMKMGIISAVPDENTAQPVDSKTAKSTPSNFTKTGGTRVIAGVKCDEYSYTAEDKSSGKVWFTKDANIKIDKRGWQKTGMGAYYGNPAFNDGLILASEAYDDKGKMTMKSETKEINPNFSHSISIKGYTLRQMNMGQPKK
jgi:hypothetical protein